MGTMKRTPVPEAQRDILRVEKNLAAIGVFTPRNTRSKQFTKTVQTTIKLPNGVRVQASAKIIGTPEYGLPIISDQDKFYAFIKILEIRRLRQGRLTNPIGFKAAELLRILGRKPTGGAYEELDEWLGRMSATMIESSDIVYLAGRKKFAKERFHIFDRVVQIGEEMDNGQIADRIYVKVSDWLLENFENQYVLPIDYELYRKLKYPIAKALTPLFQIWFYAARRNNFPLKIEKRYKELSELLGIRSAKHLSKIKETLYPSLEELARHRLIATWSVERTVDGMEFKLVATAGERFLTEREVCLLPRSPFAAGDSAEERQFQALLAELVRRGMVQDVARQVLLTAGAPESISHQIAYGDFEIARRAKTPNPIRNPAGFYRYLIQSGTPAPDHVRVQIDARKKSQQEMLCKEYALYRFREAERFLEHRYTDEQTDQRIAAIREQLLSAEPHFQHLSRQQLRDYCRSLLINQLESELDLQSLEDFAGSRG
jgi:hypothetical protein